MITLTSSIDKQTDGEFLYFCSVYRSGPSQSGGTFVCARDNCSNSSQRFNLTDAGIVMQVNITGTTSTTVSTSTSSACTPSKVDFKNNHQEAIIGSAIGVPLGIIAVLATIWALWEHRRNSSARSNRIHSTSSGEVQRNVWLEMHGLDRKSELAASHGRHELI